MNNNTIPKSEEPACEVSSGPAESLSPQARGGAVNKQFGVSKRERHLLTDREGAIIALIGSGQSNKEIARELGIAPETIKSHLKRIFQKLSASTRAQAVVRAQNFGLVKLGIGDNSLMHQAHQLGLETIPQ